MGVTAEDGPGAGVEALWSRSLFAPVPARNAFEVTVERLARGITLGVLTEGERLPAERDLAERLGVSRVTLREAIKALRAAGLVESRRGRGGGTFVVLPARDRRSGSRRRRDLAAGLDDALALRRVVEPGAAALAARRTLSAADRAGLRGYLEEATHAAESRRRLADSRLHLAIAALSGSASVTAVVADAQIRLGELLRAIPVLPANIAHSDRQHAAVVAAILEGEPDRARREMEDHVDATASLLAGLLG